MQSTNYTAKGDQSSGSRDQLSQIFGDAIWNNEELHRLLFSNIDENLFEFECHDWVTGIVMKIGRDNIAASLENIRTQCLTVLEQSDLLTRCDDDDRLDLERRMSELIGQLGFYIEAVRITDLGRAEQFIDETIDKLRTSGFVYHPRKNLFMVLCIFIHDPRLMNAKFPSLLETLLGAKLDLWTRKPFGPLFIRIISNFVAYAHCNYDLTIVDSDMQERLIIALNLELNMREKCSLRKPSPDARIDHSLMLRLCSLMHVQRPERLLDMAVTSLIANDTAMRHYSSLCLDDANHIANILDNQTVADIDASSGRYFTDKVELSIDGEAITVAQLGIDKESIVPAFETSLDSRRLQILISDIAPKELRGKNFDNIRSSRDLWLFIENALSDGPTEKRSIRSLPDVGERVSIIVSNQIGETTFECRIVDERFDGQGTLSVKGDVVEYYPKDTTLSSFWFSGKPLVLKAIVKSIDDYDNCTFTLIDDIQQDIAEQVEFGSHYTCILNNRSRDAKRFPGISTEGFSMSIGVDEETDISMLHKGMVVEVEVDADRVKDGYIQATFIRERPDVYFSVKDAFCKLMRWFSQGNVYQDNNISGQSLLGQLDDDENIVSKSHAAELLSIIDARATTEDDYKKAYNYFRFCRVLSHMLDMRDRDDYYDNRLRLIELFDDFATNSQVDRQEVDLLQGNDIIRLSATLTANAERLRILSCLNSNDLRDEQYLFDTAASAAPLSRKLATLALSHNLVKKEGLMQQAEVILDEIRERLGLPQVKKSKHYYGKEDYHTEFKTSIVYPPNSMIVDIDLQTHNIMRVICGFLNADGGRLYLGVNDMGYETDIDEDLRHKTFNGLPQKYQTYVENCINTFLGQEASHNTKTQFDDKAEGTVLRIDIQPSRNPIKLDGDYYERMGTCTRKVGESYIATFLNEHNRRNETLGDNNDIADNDTPSTESDKARAKHEYITTSRSRNNVLHDYEPDYKEITAIVCLLDNYEYMLLDDDDWQDYPLKLAIHEDETDGNIVIVYRNGNVSRVPLRDVLKKKRNNHYTRYNEQEIAYATIARDNDMLVYGFTDKRGNRRLRIDEIDRFDDNTLRDGGQLVSTLFDGLYYCEVLRGEQFEQYNLRKNMPPTDQGHSLTAMEVRPLIDALPEFPRE